MSKFVIALEIITEAKDSNEAANNAVNIVNLLKQQYDIVSDVVVIEEPFRLPNNDIRNFTKT